jgi:enamine deaminase RidA (YjgF/YER057c/UK114 family)
VTPEEALARARLTLPGPHPTVANYAMAVRTGSLLFVSGHGPFVDGRPEHIGTLGAGLSVADGQQAARVVALNMLGTIKAELGELSRVRRFVKLLVMVNATPGFTEHHRVADGATDLLVTVFGENGRPTRSAMGVASLPLGFAVEIEAVLEVVTSEAQA